MIPDVLAMSDAVWLTTWEWLIVGACLLFAGMAVVVSIGAVGDLRAMLRDLSEDE